MAKPVTVLNVIKSDTDSTPEGAEWRGEYYTFGGQQKKVFVESVEKSEVRPRIDPTTGGRYYKRGPGGTTLDTAHTERVVLGTEEREFIVVDLGNGTTRKQYQFREDPTEAIEREKKVRRAKILDQLFEKAEAAGGLDALLDAEDEPEPTPPKAKKAA